MFFLKENQKVERQDETERKTEKGKRKTERTAAAVNELYPQKGKKRKKHERNRSCYCPVAMISSPSESKHPVGQLYAA